MMKEYMKYFEHVDTSEHGTQSSAWLCETARMTGLVVTAIIFAPLHVCMVNVTPQENVYVSLAGWGTIAIHPVPMTALSDKCAI